MLRVQVRRWAPFPNVKYVAQWVENRASVYAWNDDDLKKNIAEAGINERRCIPYPETFVRTPLQNGVRLVSAIEGFEAQVWQQGFLAFSRWWPRSPSQSEWDMFLRASGIPLDQQAGPVPEPTPAEFLEVPWIHKDGYLGATWSLLEDPRYTCHPGRRAVYLFRNGVCDARDCQCARQKQHRNLVCRNSRHSQTTQHRDC